MNWAQNRPKPGLKDIKIDPKTENITSVTIWPDPKNSLERIINPPGHFCLESNISGTTKIPTELRLVLEFGATIRLLFRPLPESESSETKA